MSIVPGAEREPDVELARVLGRPERLVLAPDISARLDRDGHAIGRLTAFEDGSAEITLASDTVLDPLHPYGRCTCGCGGGGSCSWCLSTCAGCGGEPHDGDCPAFEDIYPELAWAES